MKEEYNCEFMKQCEERFTEDGMDEYRKDCDCINCALCNKYWYFYDRRYLDKKKGVNGNGRKYSCNN